jgi:hypothetical protein
MTTGDEPASLMYPRAHRPWREGAVTRANELEALQSWLRTRPDSVASEELFQAVEKHVTIARDTATGDRNPWHGITGASLQRTASNLDAAEATLLRLAPGPYLRGQLPGLLAHVRRNLPPDDPRRVRLESLVHALSHPSATSRDLTEEERGQIVGSVRAASSEAVRQLMAASSFRNLLGVTSVILCVLALGVALLGVLSPSTVPLCFAPETEGRITVVCPTAQSSVPAPADGTASTTDIDDVLRETATTWDLLTVEALGLAAAAISAAVALRDVRNTATPISIPVVLAVLKLPLGALIAVLGLLLLRGGFVPGLSALDTSAQILAWAVLLGYAQQLFTRLVDQHAREVLDDVRAPVLRGRAAPVVAEGATATATAVRQATS